MAQHLCQALIFPQVLQVVHAVPADDIQHHQALHYRGLAPAAIPLFEVKPPPYAGRQVLFREPVLSPTTGNESLCSLVIHNQWRKHNIFFERLSCINHHPRAYWGRHWFQPVGD